MKYGLLITALFVASTVFTVSAQTNDNICEEAEKIEEEASKVMKHVDSERERERLTELYEERIKEAEKECRELDEEIERNESQETNSTSDKESEREYTTDKLSSKTCRSKASEYKQKFIDRIKRSSIDDVERHVGEFMERAERLSKRCSIYSSERVSRSSEGKSIRSVKPSERSRSELDYSLPENIGQECKSRVQELKKEYQSKIEGSEEEGLREEFYQKVEKTLENCDSGPKVVNVSRAPDIVSDQCKSQVRDLNQEITSETNATVGSQVPKSYEDEYEEKLKSCMTGAVTNKIKKKMQNKIADSILGREDEDNSSSKLRKKEQKINELHNEVERLRSRLKDEDQENEIEETVEPEEETSNNSRREQDVEEAEDRNRDETETDTASQDQQKESSRRNQEESKKPGSGIIESLQGLF